MKKYIRASSDGQILISLGDFKLVRYAGIGRNNIPYDELDIVSSGLAYKFCIEIELYQSNKWYNWEPNYIEESGESVIAPIRFTYTPEMIEIAHPTGIMRRHDTIEVTISYIKALQNAVDFAEMVNQWLENHPEWVVDSIAKEDRINTFDRNNPYA